MQNLLKLDSGLDIEVFSWLEQTFISMIYSFDPKSRDNPWKCFQQLYKIMVKLLDSWFMQDLKITIIKLLLLPRRAEAGIQTSRGEK